MEGLFSKRYYDALNKKIIPYPSFARTVRKRLAMVCHRFNDAYDDEYGNWWSDEQEAFKALKEAYGKDMLPVQNEDTDEKRKATCFEDFLVYAYPHEVLDALEAFYRVCKPDDQVGLQRKLNAILTEELSPWRISDGEMYLVDSSFLDALKDRVKAEMKRIGFLGAHEEFRDALRYLQAGEIDDAIQNANRAFESALKTMLKQKEGTAANLLKKLGEKTEFFGAIPDEARKTIISNVLQGLPSLRHKVGGHGQGQEPVDVPLAYGNLAVNLAAAYIKFLLDLKREFSVSEK